MQTQEAGQRLQKAQKVLRQSCRPFTGRHPGLRHQKRQSNTVVVHATSMQHIASVKEIPEKYKGILLDQFGVLHNGKVAYPDAIEAVKALADSGRKVVILSNSSRRSTSTIPKLEKLGFDSSWFSGAITSGEITHVNLESRPDQWWQSLGSRCLHLSWGERGIVPLTGLNLQTVLDPAEADFVLSHGTEVLGQGDDCPPIEKSMDEIRALLEQSVKRGLPLIVANPDVVTVSGDGLVPMPGTFARWYTELGGEVRLMGKPDAIIYKSAMELVGLSQDQVLAIGDSLEHDIKGANSAGIDSVFIAGGIHADELKVSSTSLQIDDSALENLIEAHKEEPTFVMPYLR